MDLASVPVTRAPDTAPSPSADARDQPPRRRRTSRADGSYRLRTAVGFSHAISRSTHPFSEDFSWPDVADDFQFGAAELREAIEGMRDWSELMRPRSPEIHWEDDFDEALAEQEWEALYGRRVA